MENIVKIAEIIQYLCVSLASVFAVFGITKWRSEINYKKYTEIAEETRKLFYQVKDAVRVIRSPFGYQGEGSSRKRDSNENADDSKVMDQAYALIERMEKYSDLFIQLDSLRYKHISLFGIMRNDPFEQLSKIIRELRYSSYRLSELWRRQNRLSLYDESTKKSHFDEMEKWEAVFWEIKEDDEINKRIDEVIGIMMSKGYIDRLDKGKKPYKDFFINDTGKKTKT
jgi:hypothetical protein